VPAVNPSGGKWICAQLGAREHYAIPRILLRCGVLERLITDAWEGQRRRRAEGGRRKSEDKNQRSDFRSLRSAFSGRFHPELQEARVTAFTGSLLAFELLVRLRGLRGWERIFARNEWFQRKVVAALRGQKSEVTGQTRTLFAYSYAARKIFRYAKQRGWSTVLGQIDPGPVEEDIVAEEVSREPEMGAEWRRAPAKYWDDWREECNLADKIVVNSRWSEECLRKSGISGDKIRIIPLAYEAQSRGQRSEVGGQREYPSRFNSQRPLRVLFLGQVNLRKGAARLLKAIRLLDKEPIEFHFVGPVQIVVPDDLRNQPKIRWLGAVPRDQVDQFYRDADLFIFPTLSDGFGLTQLEAQAWTLPIIASAFCGEIVEDGVNGILLKDLSAESIAEALRACLDSDRLQTYAANAVSREKFSLKNLADSLLNLF
jgi:hypothetical protein